MGKREISLLLYGSVGSGGSDGLPFLTLVLPVLDVLGEETLSSVSAELRALLVLQREKNPGFFSVSVLFSELGDGGGGGGRKVPASISTFENFLDI